MHVPTVFLRVQRLPWLQTWVRHLVDNTLPLAAFFGYANFDAHR